ncbi:MAG: hypothetical protein ACREJ3_07290 [Polyangiaceae bacterium]
MQIPTWAMVALAVLFAIPFGYGLGVVVASLVAGPDFGQLPALTVPIAIVASIVFALLPLVKAGMRLSIMVGGCFLFLLIARMS